MTEKPNLLASHQVPYASTAELVQSIITGKPSFIPPNISIGWHIGDVPSVRVSYRSINTDGYVSGREVTMYNSPTEIVTPQDEDAFRILFWSSLQAALLNPRRDYSIFRGDRRGVTEENQNNAPFRGNEPKIIDIDGIQIPSEMNSVRRPPEYDDYCASIEQAKRIAERITHKNIPIEGYTKEQFSHITTLVSGLLYRESLKPIVLTHSHKRRVILEEKRIAKQERKEKKIGNGKGKRKFKICT